jgi:hypothetical protein
VGGIFLLKFSTEMLIRTMNGTLTHNGSQICVRFLSVDLWEVKTDANVMLYEVKLTEALASQNK